MTKPKKALKMSDEEILRRRENGESIQDLADKNGVCPKTMQRALKDMETKKEELQLMDTVGDGAGNFYAVTDINGDEITLKSRENLKNEKISQKEFAEGKTKYHKLAVAPVKLYNLKDQEPEAAPKKAKPETPKEQRTDCEIRGYLLRIDRILSAAKGINKDASEYLYDLVQQILLNGFDNEFGEKK